MSGMSSKVLSMKFMQQAENKKEEAVKQEEEAKHKDQSEWKTDLSTALKTKIKNQKKVISVGYSSINSLKQNGTKESPVIVGRRVFGEVKKKDNKDHEYLGALWKQQQEDENNKKNTNKRSIPKLGDEKESTSKPSKKRKSEP